MSPLRTVAVRCSIRSVVCLRKVVLRAVLSLGRSLCTIVSGMSEQFHVRSCVYRFIVRYRYRHSIAPTTQPGNICVTNARNGVEVTVV